MSATTQEVSEMVAPFDSNTPEANVRYSFKTTDENKENTVSVYVSKQVRENIRDMTIRSARWRSVSQFLTDAFVFYINVDGRNTESPQKMIDDSGWNSENQLGAVITDTLYREIDLLVKHSHTPWHSKQTFYICAIRAYNNAGFPVVKQR